jgi:hypothetical protein
MGAPKIKVGERQFILTASKSRIYLGYSGYGYEIRVYNHEGNMFRKIKKKYSQVRIQQNDKEDFLKLIRTSPDRSKYYFADHWPAFRYCFADDEDRLFVMTYEKGENPREALYDVFSSEGLLIARTTLGNIGAHGVLPVKATKDRIYCLKEDDEQYKELVVYKARWK